MERRLYFLFPSEQQVLQVIDELNDAGIEDSHLHVIFHEDLINENITPLEQLYRMDRNWRLEKYVRLANRVLLSVATIIFALSFMWGFYMWSTLAVLVMLASLLTGYWFSMKIPNVHLSEFYDALMRDEILLTVVVPKHRVSEIEALVHRCYPKAYGSGVGWSIEAIGV